MNAHLAHPLPEHLASLSPFGAGNVRPALVTRELVVEKKAEE
jgi:hypothetical protein